MQFLNIKCIALFLDVFSNLRCGGETQGSEPFDQAENSLRKIQVSCLSIAESNGDIKCY